MKTQGNRISNTFYAMLISIAFLSILSYALPTSFIEKYNLNRVDLFSSLLIQKNKETQPTPKPMVNLAKIMKKNQNRMVPDSIRAIEDYSENGTQLDLFLQSLAYSQKHYGNCRIAFYGDSFIEGDILTMDLRDELQKKFGGKGVGYLPMSSQVSMFRKSLPSESENWETYSISSKSYTEDLGISCNTFVPKNNAELVLYPDSIMEDIYVMYKNSGKNSVVTSTINKKMVTEHLIQNHSDKLHKYKLNEDKDSISRFHLRFEGNEKLKVYGLSIERGLGVYLDNFSIRGNSGLGLRQIADTTHRQFQKLMDYKLVILQFGLNVATSKSTDFSNYEKNMVEMIAHFKEIYPKTAFMLLSTSDRCRKKDGEYHTMPAIPLLVEAQKRIAMRSGIMFWNMYQAMGGENSMIEYVKNKNANKDYTHLTFSGGGKLAHELFKAIMFEFENYKEEITQSELAVK